MSKQVNPMVKKKLDIKDLIANADKIKQRKNETKEFYVKSLNGTVTVKKPDKQLISDSLDMEDTHQADLYIIYETVVEPNFKDSTLQEVYGAVGYEVLEEIFDPGEISTLAKLIVEFAGYGDSVEEIKN
jgi:hypothetical protein